MFDGAQFAVYTTVVSVLRSDGTARTRAAHTAGVALEAARRRKEGRYPELVGPRARSRLVVFGVEVGGRWSGESQIFIRQFARARARGEQPDLLVFRGFGIITFARNCGDGSSDFGA